MALPALTLDDKYSRSEGRIYLAGIQALVRLLLMQRRRDAAAGLDTAGFVSGYRGSPLGGLDQNLWAARRFLEGERIRFQPGINEDLAATAVWGSQQLGLFPGAKHAGVFGLWYGKGPGVDRSGDVFKHANAAGSARFGGVLAIAGDDHGCKSSTLPSQSEYSFIDAGIPVLHPAGVQEVLDLGLLGFALSRYSGCWVGFKAIADTMDSSASVSLDALGPPFVTPDDFALLPGGLNIRWPDGPLEQERRLHQWKLPAAQAFARANGLDRVAISAAQPRLGIVTTGKSYLDARDALLSLGLDDRRAAAAGIALYKVGLVWPLEREGLLRFARGLEEILVVEEKRPVIEQQVKDALYHMAADSRPRVVGKTDERGAPLLAAVGELTPARIAAVVAQRINSWHASPVIAERLAFIAQKDRASSGSTPLQRTPFFCSGCPHNTSTNVPEGSRAVGGIGCHYMATWMDRGTETFTQMGGEGVPWIGQAPFTETKHIFANLGDGTYHHSGILAIRAAVAAQVNITYKLLYNDAVAMTGGQSVDGPQSVHSIVAQLAAEGVRRIVVVSDEPEKYAAGELPPDIPVAHRRQLDGVQRELRETPGVSVLVYDQTCAAEKRRRRKRGRLPDPPKRVFINEAVCEGCGDCSRTSNCLSVIPVETEFGRKRAIDQSSCNKDFSCVEGFCPSFVTVNGGTLRKPAPAQPGEGTLPEPALAPLPWNILVTGVGGTGIVTIGALLGVAAHLEGKGASVLDMTGLAQKGGAVTSHIRIAAAPEQRAPRIDLGGTNLLLGCDMVVAASSDVLPRLRDGTTHAIINSHETITAAFTRNPDLAFPAREIQARIAAATGAESADFIDATKLATALLGDAIATNLFLLGYAYQRGLVPISAAAIEQAILINAVAPELNRDAFRWGRRAALDPAAVARAAEPAAPHRLPRATSLPEIVDRRAAFLEKYQNAAYAARYRTAVDRVAAAERTRVPGATELATAVARGLFKLMAIKDEYEVARLFTDGAFDAAVARHFEGDYRLEYHLAPPLFAKRDPATGHLRKHRYGPWMRRAFTLLARLKFLRGTPFDPFARMAERRAERRLRADYEALIEELVLALAPENHDTAVALAALPDRIRGFGHIKAAAIETAATERARLLARFRSPPPPQALAAE